MSEETKEAWIGVLTLAVFLAGRFKDGIGIDDAFAMFEKLKSDAEFKRIIEAAYIGVDKIPAEVKDLDLSEGLELGLATIPYISQFVEALKKTETAS